MIDWRGWLSAGFLFAASVASGAEPSEGRVRVVRLDYQATLKEIPLGAHVRVWVPVPQTSRHQHVELLRSRLPACGRTSIEPVYGNKILYFESSGPDDRTVSFELSYRVERREVRALDSPVTFSEIDPRQRRLFLQPNRRVPTRGKPINVLTRLLGPSGLPADPVDRARVLYDWVDRHVRYDKSRPGYGRGDAVWVCDSGYGNCTDFHSLFIAWARANGLPAKFEIGFPLPAERGRGAIRGYHCWGYFFADGKGWIPVDISEADKHPERRDDFFGNLTEDRVAFSVGRDLRLVPPQASEPLNFFIYPHVEVDGRVWAPSRIGFSVRFTDLRPPARPSLPRRS